MAEGGKGRRAERIIDPGATKQDCERAAVRRLLATLKALFPRLPLCLLFDACTATVRWR
jgi:hypothetical protein